MLSFLGFRGDDIEAVSRPTFSLEFAVLQTRDRNGIMALVENWLPPSRENWELVVWLFQFFPLVCMLIPWSTELLLMMMVKITVAQWLISWYGAGKTSGKSIFNIPGKIAWITMEVPGFISLLYVMNTLPGQVGLSSLPWENKAMGGMFVSLYFIDTGLLLIFTHRYFITSTALFSVPYSIHQCPLSMSSSG